MLNRSLLISMLLFLFPVISSAQLDNLDDERSSDTIYKMSSSIFVGEMSGDSRFTLVTRVEDPLNEGSIIGLRSELQFPLDTRLIGVRLGMRPEYRQPAGWSGHAQFAIETKDPVDLMYDTDWLDKQRVSYTQSPVNLYLSQVRLNVGREFFEYEGVRLGLFAHFDWIQVQQIIIGYEGWRDFDRDRIRTAISGSEEALDYRVSFVSPQFGTFIDFEPTRLVNLYVSGSVGWVFIVDKDKHLLRHRVSRSSVTGLGMHGRASLSVLPPVFKYEQLRIGLFAESWYYQAEGAQKQEWYGPDGMMSEGDVVNDIPIDHEAMLYQIGIEIGAIF